MKDPPSAGTDGVAGKIKLFGWVWERFGVTTIVLALALFALWRGAGLYMDLERSRQVGQAAFLQSLDKITGAVERLAREQELTRHYLIQGRYSDRRPGYEPGDHATP